MTVATTPGSHPPFYRRAWFLALVILLLVLAVLSAWAQSYDQSAQEQKLTTSHEPTKAIGPEHGVVAQAWIDSGGHRAGSIFRLWVLLENRSNSPALGFRFLAFQIPAGFRPVSCWSAGGPACRPQSPSNPSLLGLPPRIEKGQAVVVFAVLEQTSDRGPFGATGVYGWRDDRGTLWESAVVVPAMPIAPSHEHFWVVLGKALLFLKDLLLPAAVAFLGWYLQRRDKEREDEKEREQQVRDEREKELARISDTWNLMLPKIHEYAAKHYMPLAAAIRDFEDACKRVGPNSANDTWHRVLWSLLRVQRQMRYLAESIGGFYFRNLDGEELASECWDLFIEPTRDRLGARELAQALDAITPDQSLATFVDKLSEATATPAGQPVSPSPAATAKVLQFLLTKVRESFEEQGLAANLPPLELLYCILTYESNRPYELWYGRPAQVPKEKFDAALKGLQNGALKTRLIHYLVSISKVSPEGEEKQKAANPPSDVPKPALPARGRGRNPAGDVGGT